MNSSLPTLRPARWALVTVLVGFIGCKSGGMPAPPRLSNDLPNGAVSNAAIFRQQHTRFYGRPTYPQRGRRAVCEKGFKPRKCVVAIDIQVDATVAVPDPAAPPSTGYAIARLSNLDTRDTEEQYGMVPKAQADYFVWIDAMPGGGTRWTLLKVPAGSGSVQTAYTKRLVRCKPGAAGKPADVDFSEYRHDHGECGVATNVEPSANLASLLSMRPLSTLFTRIGSLISGRAGQPNGMWFECSGCCT